MNNREKIEQLINDNIELRQQVDEQKDYIKKLEKIEVNYELFQEQARYINKIDILSEKKDKELEQLLHKNKLLTLDIKKYKRGEC